MWLLQDIPIHTPFARVSTTHFAFFFSFGGNGGKLHHLICTNHVDGYSVGEKLFNRYARITYGLTRSYSPFVLIMYCILLMDSLFFGFHCRLGTNVSALQLWKREDVDTILYWVSTYDDGLYPTYKLFTRLQGLPV